jgi:hypothetical protein
MIEKQIAPTPSSPGKAAYVPKELCILSGAFSGPADRSLHVVRQFLRKLVPIDRPPPAFAAESVGREFVLVQEVFALWLAPESLDREPAQGGDVPARNPRSHLLLEWKSGMGDWGVHTPSQNGLKLDLTRFTSARIEGFLLTPLPVSSRRSAGRYHPASPVKGSQSQPINGRGHLCRLAQIVCPASLDRRHRFSACFLESSPSIENRGLNVRTWAGRSKNERQRPTIIFLQRTIDWS